MDDLERLLRYTPPRAPRPKKPPKLKMLPPCAAADANHTITSQKNIEINFFIQGGAIPPAQYQVILNESVDLALEIQRRAWKKCPQKSKEWTVIIDRSLKPEG